MAGAGDLNTGGCQKGAPNRFTAALRDMIAGAPVARGGQAYSDRQAEKNPAAFLSLVGKCLSGCMGADAPPEPIVIRRAGDR